MVRCKLTEHEKIKQAYIDGGWNVEITERGAEVFTMKVSDIIITTKLSEETKRQLQRAFRYSMYNGKD